MVLRRCIAKLRGPSNIPFYEGFGVEHTLTFLVGQEGLLWCCCVWPHSAEDCLVVFVCSTDILPQTLRSTISCPLVTSRVLSNEVGFFTGQFRLEQEH